MHINSVSIKLSRKTENKNGGLLNHKDTKSHTPEISSAPLEVNVKSQIKPPVSSLVDNNLSLFAKEMFDSNTSIPFKPESQNVKESFIKLIYEVDGESYLFLHGQYIKITLLNDFTALLHFITTYGTVIRRVKATGGTPVRWILLP